MKRLIGILVVGIVLMTISGVIAQSQISGEVEDFVKKVANKKGISEQEIESVEEVDFSNLPKEVKLENIDNTNLALYKINTAEKPTFVISASGRTIEKITSQDIYTTSLLNFGISGEENESQFMETSAGVKTSSESGYVMLNSGSITGISTSIEILENNFEPVKIIIYKNGEPLGLTNQMDTSLTGFKKDYAIQSKGIVAFSPGDVISVYINSNGARFKDAVTLVEITSP